MSFKKSILLLSIFLGSFHAFAETAIDPDHLKCVAERLTQLADEVSEISCDKVHKVTTNDSLVKIDFASCDKIHRDPSVLESVRTDRVSAATRVVRNRVYLRRHFCVVDENPKEYGHDSVWIAN